MIFAAVLARALAARREVFSTAVVQNRGPRELFARVAISEGAVFKRGGGELALRRQTRKRVAISSTNRETRAEPQQIVAQRLLSCLQYPDSNKSSTEDLT